MAQQCLARALAALRGVDVEVFQIQPETPQPGGKVEEVQGKAQGLAILLADNTVDPRVFAEQQRFQLWHGGLHFIQRPLVECQVANELQDKRAIVRTRLANREGAHQVLLQLRCIS